MSKKYILGSLFGLSVGLFAISPLLDLAQAYPQTVPNTGGMVIEIDNVKGNIDKNYDYVIQIYGDSVKYKHNGKDEYSTHMPLQYSDESSQDVEQLSALLKAIGTQAHAKVKIEIAGVGGYGYMMYDLYSIIKSMKADVTMHVVGNTYSAHSVVALAGDRLIVAPGVVMMFHLPNWTAQHPVLEADGSESTRPVTYFMCVPGTASPYDEINSRAEVICQESKEFTKQHIKHVLTDKQYEYMINGIDVYVYGFEVQEKFIEFYMNDWEREESTSISINGVEIN